MTHLEISHHSSEREEERGREGGRERKGEGG